MGHPHSFASCLLLSQIEELAVSAIWPSCIRSLCVWHVLERAARSKLTKWVGTRVASIVCGSMWRLVRASGHRRHGPALDQIVAGIREAYKAVGSPAIPPRYQALSVDRVIARLKEGTTGTLSCARRRAHLRLVRVRVVAF